MKKYFLLTVGDNHYPCSGTSDWIGTYETHEEAEAAKRLEFGSRGDWYYIIDLRKWIGTDDNEYDPEMYR